MAIKTKDGWHCSVCNKVFIRSQDADSCRDNHTDIVYVAIDRSLLMRLIQFIYTGDRSLLDPKIVQTLNRYIKLQ
jgi:hypothetical protein